MVDSFVFLAYAEYILVILIYGYASFWAFNIRRALAVGLYRSQASGTGLVAALLTLVFGIIAVNVTGNQVIISPFTILAALMVFYFIDASVLAGRRSDPLLRDTLGWMRARRFMWGLVLVLAAVSGLSTLALPVSLYTDPVVIILTQSVYFVIFAEGAIALPLSAVRSKDLALRIHYRWLGGFLVFFILFVALSAPIPPINFASGGGFSAFIVVDFQLAFATLFAAGYCLYRSARSLVPLNKLSLQSSD